MIDCWQVFPVHEAPTVEEQEPIYLEGVSGYVCRRVVDLEQCGLCRRGICIQTVRFELDGDAMVLHGSWVA